MSRNLTEIAFQQVSRAAETHRDKRLVHLSIDVHPETARKIANLLSAELSGGAVVLSELGDLTTTRAALTLGVSRPALVKMLTAGEIPFHMAGSHMRIKYRDLEAFIESESDTMRRGLREINEIDR